MYTSFAAVAVDGEGKLAAVCYDEVQPKVTFDEAGEITSDPTAEIKTKREKKDEYGMRSASAISDETLKAGCTMSVGGMIQTVVKAMGLVG